MPALLISGASRGIGRVTALRLARSGWDVYATVRRAEDGEALSAEAGANLRVLELDVTSDAQIVALEGRLPERLDAVVNNAGCGAVAGGSSSSPPSAAASRPR